MPALSNPPNVVPIAGSEAATQAWQQWFTSAKRELTGQAFYIPAVAGVPTFTPEVRAGFVPMVFDITNNNLYVYDGSWIKVTLA